MDCPEVIDNAVKIGLAAIIAAFATLAGVWMAGSRDLKKDRRRRRQDALEKIIDDFEHCHAATRAFFALYLAFVENMRKAQSGAERSVVYNNTLRLTERHTEAYFGTLQTLSTLVGPAQMLGLRIIAE